MVQEKEKSLAERVATNTAYLLAAEVVTRALSFLLILAVARLLGDTGLGIYSFVFAFSSMLLMFGDIGTTIYLNRELARDKSKTRSYLSAVLGMKVAMSAVFVLITAGVVLFATKSAEVKLALLIVGIATLFSYLATSFKVIFLAYERNEFYAIVSILEVLISTAVGIVLLLRGFGINVFLAAFILSYFSSFLLGAFFVWKKFSHFFPSFNIREWTGIIKVSVPFWLTQALVIIYYRLDTLMLTAMTNFAVVGWYNAAYRPVEALLFIPIVVTTAVFPSMSRLHFTSKEQLRSLYSKLLYYLLTIILPIAFGTTILADRIILLFYPQSFLPAVLALKILIWSEVFIFLNYITGYLLNAINKQALFTLSVFVYTLLNAVLNLFLIPRYQHVGAAIATLAATSIGFLTLNRFAARNGYPVNVPRLLWKPLVSAVVMSAVLISLLGLQFGLNIVAFVAIGGMVYVALMLLLRGFGRPEFDLLKKFIPIAAVKNL